MGAALAGLATAVWKRRFAWTDLALWLWMFVAVRGVMLLRSPLPGEAVRWWGLLCALAFWHHAACGLCSRARWSRMTTPLFAAMLAVLGLLAVGQWVFHERQASALFANRNFAAAGFAMLLPFALAWGRRAPVALGLLGLLATQSRGGLLAAACAAGLWFAWTRPRLRLPLLVGVPVLVLAVGLVLGRSNTVKVRLAWYGAAFETGLEQPLLGAGAGGFAREYPPRRGVEEHSISGGTRVHAVHNDYLEAFAEGGVLGLGAMLLLWVFVARAARGHRTAACSLLAFAVAALVDLPVRDPSLLALAAACLPLVARRSRFTVWAAVPGLVVVAALWPNDIRHWQADRLFARYLETRDRALLDEALSIERRHRGALIERSSEKDLELLLELEPHHAGARYNRTRDMFDEDAIAALRTILREHDPHHTLTRTRLAVLLMKTDPIAAASVLDDAIRADDRPWRPWALRARIFREAGRLKQADRFLFEAETRADNLELRRERLRLELARGGDVVAAARRVNDPDELRSLIRKALARAEAEPPPRLEKQPNEDAIAYAARVQKAKERWRGEQYPHFKEAAQLAGALVHVKPTADNFRLLAKAAAGTDDVEGVIRAKGWAAFLDTLLALKRGDLVAASGHFKTALRAYPKLLDDPAAVPSITAFIRANPKAEEAALVLFRPYEPFRKAVLAAYLVRR